MSYPAGVTTNVLTLGIRVTPPASRILTTSPTQAPDSTGILKSVAAISG
jgi:hypothetical protein